MSKALPILIGAARGGTQPPVSEPRPPSFRDEIAQLNGSSQSFATQFRYSSSSSGGMRYKYHSKIASSPCERLDMFFFVCHVGPQRNLSKSPLSALTYEPQRIISLQSYQK